MPRAILYFNPRSRTGSDGGVYLLHFPNRGLFQPTLPHRERRALISPMDFIGLFQPTLPHRERLSISSTLASKRTNFNPRSRTGSDDHKGRSQDTGTISTHAPAQGATEGEVFHQPQVFLFQPTLPHRERRLLSAQQKWPRCISTHAPAQGATDHLKINVPFGLNFNPRSRTGSDSKRIQKAPFHFVQNRKESFG